MRISVSAVSHFAMTTFCWLPPERLRTLLTDARRLDVEPMDALLGGRARPAEVDQTDRVGEPAEGREDDVRFDVHPDASP